MLIIKSFIPLDIYGNPRREIECPNSRGYDETSSRNNGKGSFLDICLGIY